ncbi:DNA polymerase alpha subunit B [Thecamonas trahens ATCC 50062]|uniref:DNA polymerase alpha subunit B n=1 Tax=Thecamonas trahens ATCC 50062 TaxID=461836 RepID=A0A0L0DKV9_THETB|nr:DNA polymerase alpha subunit B [Thecamonas trahens ATCC 50062]KNC51993.1 DNA polymerase alpha subunit B [Thecamonas trahens ATCC 50062]|eukprot:XP_013755577.1 DNA polymerase alpha subunit B [Thecamonas trahens ATCC 50062]
MRLTQSGLVAAFASANIDLEAEDGVVGRCLNICALHGLSADELLNSWDAYVCNHPEAHALTLDHLDILAAELQTKADRAQFKAASKPQQADDYDISNISALLPPPTTDMFAAYDVPNEELKKTVWADARSPVKAKPVSRVAAMRGKDAGVAQGGEAGLAPAGSPSSRYRNRQNAGQVVDVLNPRVAPKDYRLETSAARVTLALEQEFHNFRYMYDKIGGKVTMLEERTRVLGDELLADAQLPDPLSLAVPRQEPFVGLGRVCCDSEGKLNDKSVMLEGSAKLCSGFRVPLDLSHLPEFSLFPGQIIGVEGLNLTGASMLAGQIYTPPSAPKPTTERDTLAIYHHYGGELVVGTNADGSDKTQEFEFMEGKPLAIIVAGGPYTTSDGLDFAPLRDLLARIVAEAPDVAILMGPFLNEGHPALEDPMLEATYEELFEQRIAAVINAEMEGIATRFVLVPSLRDIQHDHVFPQPPLPADLGLAPTVSRLSNPCVFSINEMVVAVSTNDVLMALSSEETFRVPQGAPSDRMTRLVRHIISQRSFYPVFPPPPGSQLDFSQSRLLNLGATPDILILASDLRYFVKDVDGAVVVNPGRLTVGSAGGTFARLTVHPMPEDDIGEGEEEIEHNVAARCRAEIIRI